MSTFVDQPVETPQAQPAAQNGKFFPPLPETLEQTGLHAMVVEELVLKVLLGKGVMSGREMAEEICIPFKILSPILHDMKQRQYIVHKSVGSLGDFVYTLTEMGKESAMLAKELCAYAGAAPVVFADYVESVAQQSIRKEKPGMENLKRAYGDILLPDHILNTIGPAVNSGRGIFLFGEPGNGKTLIAERIRDCFSEDIFIPRTLWIEGEIVQLYDPQNHEDAPVDPNERYDPRWVKIKRPTVMVGGELTMEALDLCYNPVTKISEAPFQLKANCGTFLIDDFGRQRVDHRDLLNRWIVPLEKHFDFLVLSNGRKIQVPFDQLIIFSTNLEPSDLVDDAFLRRIPYKIEIKNPTLEEFKRLFIFQCDRYKLQFKEDLFNYLVETHYQAKKINFKCCHPRDILDQVRNYASYRGIEPEITKEALDEAVRNYFAAMGLNEEPRAYKAVL